ncbi:AraC family transcriptional regulator [Gayadomonas joobiniege]|uniref:AraC family transcriptional regulator n=1 Tax=Gayadomonas joobiniege TaxID=1234606 RepID=UPI0003623ABC|nr:AraC family transcriptional regulator [Gayadomonas joobiniege]
MKDIVKVARYFSQDGVLHADNCDLLEKAAREKKLTMSAISRRAYPGQRLADYAMPGLLSFGVWDCRKLQDWHLTPHRNEGVEITYLAKGSLNFTVDEQSYVLTKGAVSVTRPWQKHSLGAPKLGYSKLFWLIIDLNVQKPDDQWRWPAWVVLDVNEMASLTNYLQHTEQHVWMANQKVQSIFKKLNALLIKQIEQSQSYYSLITLCINELLLSLLDLFRSQTTILNNHLSSKTYTVERFLQALPEVCEQAWDLTQMANECGLKRSQFSEYCYQLKGMSPNDYLTTCRIDKAKRLLMNSALNITQVAFSAGFSSSQYFATVFKKKVGMTPILFKNYQLIER